MPSLPRNCPECSASLKSIRPQPSGRFRCPECSVVIKPSIDDDDRDDAPRSRSDKNRSSSQNERSTRRDRDDSRRPRRRKEDSTKLIIFGVAGGVVVICLIGAIVALVQRPKKNETPFFDNRESAKENPRNDAQPPRNQWKEPIRAASALQGGGAAVPLKELKAASVYVKGATGPSMATGSGFVFRSFEETAYVVTNHHVVTDMKLAALSRDKSSVLVQFPRQPSPPQMRRPGIPQPPFGPGFRPGPGPGFQPGPGTQPGIRIEQGGTGLPHADLSVVFRSGTPEEQEVKATIVADDADVDLAILKVTGVRNVPNPIDCDREPKLVETDSVLALGFPFGAALDPGRPNPAITISKGAITSLRHNSQGELEMVQIDADINPGNSGGPIVDEKTGALVGIAVAKVKNTRVGFAIPVHKLNQLVESRTNQR